MWEVFLDRESWPVFVSLKIIFSSLQYDFRWWNLSSYMFSGLGELLLLLLLYIFLLRGPKAGSCFARMFVNFGKKRKSTLKSWIQSGSQAKHEKRKTKKGGSFVSFSQCYSTWLQQFRTKPKRKSSANNFGLRFVSLRFFEVFSFSELCEQREHRSSLNHSDN